MFAALTRVVEFLITSIYMGRVPLAVHNVSVAPNAARTTGAGDTTFGGTKTRMIRLKTVRQ